MPSLPLLRVQFSCCAVIQSCLILCYPPGLQHVRLPCPSPSSRACSISCPLSLWYHPAILSSFILLVLLLLCSVFPSIRVFSNELALWIRWPKYWSFSFNISPSSEYPGLISFRMDGLVGSSCSPKDSPESSQTPQSKNTSSSVLSFLHSPTLTSIHDHWKKHSLD